MSNIVKFPKPDEPAFKTKWYVKAYRRSDFALSEETFDDESEAHAYALWHFRMGFDVDVHRHAIEAIAKWVYTK